MWRLLLLICVPTIVTIPNHVLADTPEIHSSTKQLENTTENSITKENEFVGPEKENKVTEESFIISPNETTWEFIDLIGEDAHKIAQRENLYASVMIAQAILETSSGQSQLSQAPYYNIFGIKGIYKGKSVSFNTLENKKNGEFYTTNTTFRHYENYEDSLKDYAELLKNGLIQDPTFYKGVWKTEAASYEEATAFLTGRYATDIHYNKKLNALIEAYDLTSFDETGDETNTENTYISPVKDAVITSTYGDRNGRFHRGIDLAAGQGTEIKAAKQGKITYAGYHPSWGNYVTILHPDGLTTLYAHCSQNLAKIGQKVDQGQTIALMGSTGNSTGPHLHFEVNGSQTLTQEQLINPLTILNR